MKPEIEITTQQREPESSNVQLAVNLNVNGEYRCNIWSLDEKIATDPNVQRALKSAVERGYRLAIDLIRDTL